MPKSDLIAEEIKWCEAHRNPQAQVYQDGFIAGLRHALFLMNSSPTQRAADFASRGGISLEPKGSHKSNPFTAQDKPQSR